jgi:hypothetical protein
MGSVHARGDTFLTFGLKALTETNTSRLATAVVIHLHKVHGITSTLIILNEKSEARANVLHQTSEYRGLLTKGVGFYGENTKSNSGGITRPGSKNGFHTLKH